ncbi:MAG: GlcNAc-transferase family protein [Vicinamibacterales bacterium]
MDGGRPVPHHRRPWQASRGACWARAEIMGRYAGEDYYLQLDSHHRFADGWDELAIDELDRARPIGPS